MMKQSDYEEFIQVMETKIRMHKRQNYWKSCKRSEIPKGMTMKIYIFIFKHKNTIWRGIKG